MALKDQSKKKLQRSNSGKEKKIMASAKPLKAIAAKQTKVQILKTIAEETGLKVKEVSMVFATASHLAKCHLMKKGSGEFSVPEMAIKIVRKTKPATKKRPGRNPLTGEAITIAAKPERKVIKIKALKTLKEILA